MTAGPWRLQPKFVFLSLLGVLIFFGFVFKEKPLVAIGHFLISDDSVDKADAIVVLLTVEPERILEAVDLYRSGYAPRLVMAQSDGPENYQIFQSLGVPFLRAHEQYTEVSKKLGVQEKAIEVIPVEVDSTYQEAQVVRDYCLSKGWQSIIVVTSITHTKRSRIIFKHLMKEKVKIMMRKSSYDTFDPSRWWKERRMIREVLLEYQKIIHFYLVEVWKKDIVLPASGKTIGLVGA